MGLIELVLVISALSFCLFLLFTFVVQDELARKTILVVIVLFVIVLILQEMGYITGHRFHL